MRVCADLHFHSGYSGGVGRISLERLAGSLSLKGINIMGTGDCLHPAWLSTLEDKLVEEEDGLYRLASGDHEGSRFVLQTEIIVTTRAPGGGRKQAHIVVLFPSIETVKSVASLLTRKYGMKNTIGRPFVKCETRKIVEDLFYSIRKVSDLIEFFPAHVMIPTGGLLGSTNPVPSMEWFFGGAVDLVSAVETGLSADPVVLSLIPELDDKTMISSSDAHSHRLDRVGREFTMLDLSRFSYEGLVKAIRENRVVLTGEFHPAEGRYYLSGHRSDRPGHDGTPFIYHPAPGVRVELCPLCGRPPTRGVLERALELGEEQGRKWSLSEAEEHARRLDRRFVRMVPLAELVRAATSWSLSSKRLATEYEKIVRVFGSEAALWASTPREIEKRLSGIASERVLSTILMVARGEFCYNPPGHDGVYGRLVIGETLDYEKEYSLSRWTTIN